MATCGSQARSEPLFLKRRNGPRSLNPEMRASVQHCLVSLEHNATCKTNMSEFRLQDRCKEIAPRRIDSGTIAGHHSKCSVMVQSDFSVAPQAAGSTENICLQGRSLGNARAHTQRRGRRKACGWLGLLSLPRRVVIFPSLEVFGIS